jgi:hypothetical protein
MRTLPEGTKRTLEALAARASVFHKPFARWKPKRPLRRPTSRPAVLRRTPHRSIGALLGAILLFKIVLFLWGVIAFPFGRFPHDTVLSIWNRWDSTAYLTIARQWYTPTNLAPDYFGFISHFPPLYPIVTALVSRLSGAPLVVAGMAVSWTAILVASYFLYRLVKKETGNEATALYSAAFLNLWPLAYFTLTTYAESLFILLAVLSFYALRHQAFAWAGIAAGAAILTRLPGVVLVPAFGVALWRLYRARDPRLWPAAAYLGVIPGIAVLCYLAINATSYNDPFFFQHEYKINPYSGKRLIVPLSETLEHLRMLIVALPKSLNHEFMMNHGWNAIFTLIAVTLTIVGIRMGVPWDYSVFAIGSILFFASFSWGISNARYTLPIFPLFVVLARFAPRWRLAVAALCVPPLFYFTKVYTRGTWAF